MNRFFHTLLYQAWRRPERFRIAAGLLLLLSAVLAVTSEFSSGVAGIFPEKSRSGKLFRNLTENKNGSEKIVVLFSKTEKTASAEKLQLFLDQAAAEAKQIKGITAARVRVFDLPPSAMAEALVSEIPSTLPPSSLPTGKELEKKCRSFYRQLVLTGTGRTEMMRLDPLNLTIPLLRRLQKFRSLSGVNADPSSGYLFSPDGDHAMMILSADLRLSDSRGTRKVVSELREILSPCPNGYRYDLLSPLLHTVANEDAMRRDITKLGILSLILFPLLFLAVYKGDLKSLFLPLVPFLAMLPACAFLRLIFGKILLLTVGMGGIVAGLGVDYGIHLYAASNGGIRRMMRIVPSLIPALVTSLLAFCVFLLSGAEAFLQFGLFASVTLFFSFLFYLMLMPGIFLSQKKKRPEARKYELWNHPARNWTVWILLTLLFAAGAVKVHFSRDFRNFDIGKEKFASATGTFNRAFRTAPPPGVVLFPAQDELEKALPRLKKEIHAEIFSFSDLTGTESSRAANRALWRQILPERKKELEKAMSRFGVGKEFLSPFFRALEKGSSPEYGESIFCKPFREFMNRPGCEMLFFADTPGTAEKIMELTEFPVLSENSTSKIMTEEIIHTLIPVGITALLLVLAVILIDFRRTPIRIFTSFLPLVSAFLATVGICGLLGKDTDLSTLISGIIVAGISVDYGIIMSKDSGIPKSALCGALTFSAVTSAAGGMTVLFSEHRMLSSAGLTIIAGILAAWGTGIFIVPLLLKHKSGMKKALFLLLPLILTGCLSEPFAYCHNGPLAAEIKTNVPSFTVECSAVLDWRFGKVTFLAAASREKDGTFRIAGMNPAGALLFTVSGKDEIQWFIPGVPESRGRFAAEKTARALQRIFCYTGNGKNIFEGNPPRLERRTGKGWRIRYAKWKNDGKFLYPEEALYDEDGVRLAVRTLRYGEIQ